MEFVERHREKWPCRGNAKSLEQETSAPSKPSLIVHWSFGANKTRKFGPSSSVRTSGLSSLHIPVRRCPPYKPGRMFAAKGLKTNQYLINRTIKSRLKRDRFFFSYDPVPSTATERENGVVIKVRSNWNSFAWGTSQHLDMVCILRENVCALLLASIAIHSPSANIRASATNFNFQCDLHTGCLASHACIIM